MTLIVEDGTVVANANSYVTVADFRTYAAARNIDVDSKTDDELEAALLEAMDYIEGKRDLFQGCKTSTYQALQWPRNDVWVDKMLKSNSSIPREIEYAQYALANEALTNDLQPTRLTTAKGPVTREKVGDIEVVYDNSNPQKVPAFAKAETLLTVLYKRNGLSLIRS